MPLTKSPVKLPKPKVKRAYSAVTTPEATLYLAVIHALVALGLPDPVLGSLLHTIETARGIPEPPDVLQAVCETGGRFGRCEMLARCVVAVSEAIQQRRALKASEFRPPAEGEPEQITPFIIRIEPTKRRFAH